MHVLLAMLLTVLAPTEDGLVLGTTVEVEIRSSRPPASCTIDGLAAVPSGGWTALPYAERWLGRFALATTGRHELVLVATSGARTLAHFESTRAGPVAIGDLAAAHFLAAKPTTTLGWDWGPGVFLHGLHRFARVSKDRPRLLAATEAYYTHHLAKGLPKIDRPDPCAPALGALALAREEGVASALPAARKVASYLASEPRNAVGAIDHLGANSLYRALAIASVILEPWARSIWCDSLMMYGVFAAQWGHSQNDPALLDFGAAQPAIFAALLQDPVTGLFTHAWDVRHARPLGVRWLRGNGWAAASTLDILDELPANHPRRAQLERIAKDHLRGLAAVQMSSGLWDSVCDRPGASYAESSGSALAAYALAKGARMGLAPAGARAKARHAFEALVARLERRTDGFAVAGVSGATNPTPMWIYTLVPRTADKDYGTGSFLLLAEELAKETW